jgi:hypothetical protein
MGAMQMFIWTLFIDLSCAITLKSSFAFVGFVFEIRS